MPKEIIYTPSCKFAPVVSWTRDVGVQVAVIDMAAAEGDESAGNFADMDRQSMNRLIEMLRRARNQAFGADA